MELGWCAVGFLLSGAGLGWVCSIYITTAKPVGKKGPNGQSVLTL